MVQNLVLNNSAHNFSVHSDGIRADMDQTKVIASAGTVAAISGDLRGELESGSLVPRDLRSSGRGVHTDFNA